MAYSAEISRTNPGCFLFLLDQSGSMADPWGGASDNPQTKSQTAADVINRWLMELVLRCTKSEGVRDYFHVGVLGYGAHVGPALGGTLQGREMVPVSELANNPLRVEDRQKRIPDGAGGLVDQSVKFPVWFDAVADDGTPMCSAFSQAHRVLHSWVEQHRPSFPPILINISDGEPTDGDPSQMADAIRQLEGDDGNALVFNVHISSAQAGSIEFPDSEGALPDEHAQLLFRMSSPLTDQMRAHAQQSYGSPLSPEARGFSFNADAVSLVKFLDIGTRVPDLR